MKMKESPRRSFIWGLIYPLLVYFGISLLVQVIAGFVVAAYIVSDTGVISTQEQFQAIIYQAMDVYLNLSYYMTIASAAISIPFMYLFYRKDKRLRLEMGEEIVYRQASVLEYVLVALIAFGACIGGNNLIMASGLITVDATYQELSEVLYSASLPVQIIGTVLIVPLCEELIFRGLLYNRLKEKVPAMAAMWMSALAFGAYHGNLVQLIYAAILGFLMAYVYEKYHNFLAPYLFHATANLLSVLITETVLFDFMYKNRIMMIMSGIVGLLIVAYGVNVVRTTVNLDPEDPESKVEVEL